MTEVDLDIQNHWQKKANDHGAEQTATHSDTYLRKLEIEAISSHLTENSKIIDVGCGNGFSTMEFAKHYINKGLEALTNSIKDHSDKYCIGDELTIVDICLLEIRFQEKSSKKKFL